MSIAFEYIEQLYTNPFIFEGVLATFYTSLKAKQKSLLLSYLVLPVILYPSSKKYLAGRRDPRGSFRVFLRQKERLYGLGERIKNYKNLTNTILQYNIDKKILTISDDLEVIVKKRVNIFDPSLNKASERFGELLKPFDIPTIYRMMGVKKI